MAEREAKHKQRDKLSQGSSIRGVDSSAAGSTSTPYTRRCSTCNAPIPLKRLLANPYALDCVPCLEAAGDVKRYKRFDEYVPNGDRVETLFTDSPVLEAQIAHMNSAVPNDEDFEAAMGTATEIEAKPNPAAYAAAVEDEDLDELDAPLDADSLEELVGFLEDEDADQYQTKAETIKRYYAATA